MCPVSTLSTRQILILEELYLTREEKRKSDEERKKVEQELGLAQDKVRKMEKVIKKMEQNMKTILDQKMEIELQLADIVDGHNINEQAIMLKMKKIKKYACHKEMSLQYAYGAIVILMVVIISMLGFFRCAK